MKYTVTADWHLRPDSPRCRSDENWEKTMEKMIQFIVDTNKGDSAKLTIIGDLFDFSQQPPWIVNMFLDLVPDGVIFAGNHDFKHRNMNEIEASSIGHLLKNPKYEACVPEIEDGFFEYSKDLLFCHRLVYSPENAGLEKFKNGISVDTLIEEAADVCSSVKWIFIGDNHHKFHHISPEGIHVINPGSPLIYNASMIGSTCGFYTVDTDKETVEFHEVPDNPDILTDKYLRDKEAHSEKMQEFVASLNDSEVKTMDFFELCDEKAKSEDKEFLSIYEDIKTETIQIKTKLGKGA